MKAYLMYSDRDFRAPRMPRPGATGLTPDLIQDLELATMWDAMAGGDEFLRDVAQGATLSSLTTPDEIRYRQNVLADCFSQPAVVRNLYDLAVEAITGERHVYRSIFINQGEPLLRRSIEAIEMFVGVLRRLRAVTEEHEHEFRSDGFQRFFAQLRAELDDDYFDEIEAHLKALRFRDGVLISATLGTANRGTGYLLRTPNPDNRSGLFNRTPVKKPTFSMTIPDRDEAGFRALGDLRDRGINAAASSLAQASDHVLSFFVALRTEVGFYLGVLNLHEELTTAGAPTCYPDPAEPGQLRLTARDLYDPCLSVRMQQRVTGNDIDADGKNLIIITGANQGGKSTFLRSLGLAHLMMQCGMFVAASSFYSTVTLGIYTHYKREEDDTMTSGKFDEELARMSHIADAIGPDCLLMCNESFAATNEREGSDIATEVIRSMNDAGIRIVFVTHMFDLAHRFDEEHAATTLFLRAERGDEGRRTYRLTEGAPLPTSFGEDLYRQTFQSDHRPRPGNVIGASTPLRQSLDP
jgi:DNA mismatch repair ATPase MutS